MPTPPELPFVPFFALEAYGFGIGIRSSRWWWLVGGRRRQPPACNGGVGGDGDHEKLIPKWFVSVESMTIRAEASSDRPFEMART